MLLRKRAWDFMREEPPTVTDAASLAEVMRTLRTAMKEDPELRNVIVTDKAGHYKGTVSIWTILRQVEKSVFRDSDMRLVGENDWDRILERAVRICPQTGIEEMIETEVARIKPSDPLLAVLEIFLSKKRWRYAVVEEGGKAMGIVLAADVFRELTRDMIKSFK